MCDHQESLYMYMLLGKQVFLENLKYYMNITEYSVHVRFVVTGTHSIFLAFKTE